MATRRKPRPEEKIQVHTRLYRGDVDELRRRATADGLPWQTLLRSLVKKALRDQEARIA